MSTGVIKIENLSKQYRLGEVGTGTISHDINRWWHRVRGKEDPYLRVGETNNRAIKGDSEYVWALRDINFEVTQGEVLGIIGKNGAGKSTLLKILSKVTAPTTGYIKAKGRIASLLEVGTGFHPELTGRENIYLNGTILGMTKQEVNVKLDEIVDFSGVERYLDTPVKRYSSGMMVRLGFAVAAHLEPEILIVDEVLAVGDADFQKKCIGKMKDVSEKDGRTILFVSHNMVAVKQLCTKGLLLINGTVSYQGTPQSSIDNYLNLNKKENMLGDIPTELERYNTGEAFITRFHLYNEQNIPSSNFYFKEDIYIVLTIKSKIKLNPVLIDVTIVSSDGIVIAYIMNPLNEHGLEEGMNTFKIKIANDLQIGSYQLNAGIHHASGATIDYLESIFQFKIIKISRESGKDYPYDFKHGYFLLESKWTKTS